MPKEVRQEKPEEVTAYECCDCGEISEEYLEEPLYECQNCDTRFNRNNSADGMSHTCPDCGKFSSRVADRCCDSCEGGEIEEIVAYRCPTCDLMYEAAGNAMACCAEKGE